MGGIRRRGVLSRTRRFHGSFTEEAKVELVEKHLLGRQRDVVSKM